MRVPIGQDGSAAAPELVVDLTGSQPDGIALAADGTMFVGCYRPDRIWRIPPGREPEVLAEDSDGVVLNVPAWPSWDRSSTGWRYRASAAGALWPWTWGWSGCHFASRSSSAPSSRPSWASAQVADADQIGISGGGGT
jgi:hypothetical protein